MATRIFIYSSIAFGVVGILLALVSGPGKDDSEPNIVLMKLLMIAGFIILPSFALSVASKYLDGKL
jgi:hypothetical protein